MPLDQAGLQLVLKNYRQYMDRLRQIDKEQRRVFRDPGRGTENALRRHRQKVLGLEDAYRGLQKVIALVFASKVVREGAEEIERALDFRRLSTQFENLANSSGQSANEMVEAMRRASHGMLSNFDAITAALGIMRLEVASSPAELEEFIRLGIALRPPFKSAAEAVTDLTSALGRRSLLVLDNFFISSRQARREMERMAQVKFGQDFESLDKASKDALFMEASLSIMRRDFQRMGGDIEEIVDDTAILKAKFDDLRLVVGEALVPGAQDMAGTMAQVLDTLAKIVALAGAAGAGFEAMVKTLSSGTVSLLELLATGPIGLGKLATGIITGRGPEGLDLGELFNQAQVDFLEAYTDRMGDFAQAMGVFTDETIGAGDALDDFDDGAGDATDTLKALAGAVDQAAQIQRSFVRAQEDALRKAGRQADKLQRKQAKELVKLQTGRDKELAELVQERIEEQTRIEADGAKDILRGQQNLLRQLRHEEERFNLSRLQGRRRFNLQDRRLRAEGDILALQQLREDQALQEREQQENFDLSQRQQKEAGRDQVEQQQEDQREQLRALGDDIEKRRQEILGSYQDELAQLQAHHAEQREEQSQALAEQLEDLRLNRQRQLEDLGYHLGQQEAITREGAQNVADELERVFGVEGVADLIMSGYVERTEGRFADLFRTLEKTVTTGQITAAPLPELTPRQRAFGVQHGFSGVVTGPQSFFVEPGVREFVYASPMAGGGGRHDVLELAGGATFNIAGAERSSPGAVDAALDRMVLEFEMAMRRVGRRG